MSKSKALSNPFSTGGGGFHFEAHVQASFVVLMLTGGCAPCLPCWPIKEIKLQGKIDGFDTDDLVVIVENQSSKEQRKLLGQVRHSIAVTSSNTNFGEFMQGAWNDFNDPEVFTRGKDVISLITGPLNATDTRNALWLLDQAKYTKDMHEFFAHVNQAKFSPSKSAEKLNAIRQHLKAANDGNEVTRDELYEFLNYFHILSYDLGSESGVALSLLHSHISQFQQHDPKLVWSRVVEFVQTWNQNAGTVTRGSLPEGLLEAFKGKTVVEIPKAFEAAQEKPIADWSQHPDSTYLALAVLIGAWNERSQSDLDTISQLLGISYDEWLKKAQEFLHYPDSPLSVKNGIWKVVNRVDLWSQLGSRILDQNLDAFKTIAVSILTEPAPAFELPIEERYKANLLGKVLKCSLNLRKGIAEGLAIVSSKPDACGNCTHGEVEKTCLLAVREILYGADWVRWGSLNILLPTLAEAAPSEFLAAVEKALDLTPCPFDELFTQEGDGITGGNYLTGLLWALEDLAWDEQYLVRVCVILGELASHDPGGQWTNRPSNSLEIILLPWFPQTLASVDKRKAAVQTLLNEWPEIAWNLIIQLLPGQSRTSSGSHKPSWRMTIPDNGEKGVTNQEYWQQASFYAELAVTAAGHDIGRLSELINHFDNLPKSVFDQLIKVLSSQPVSALPEEQRLSLWNHLTNFTKKHRRFSDAEWALPEDLIVKLDLVSEQLAPTNPFNLYQRLFNFDDFKLYEENDDWEKQRQKLNTLREKAILEVFQQEGVEGVIRFAESVNKPHDVGNALGVIADCGIERELLPQFLNTPNNKHQELASGFIWQRYHIKNWEWCDNIDKSGWTPAQIGQFLAYLPFVKELWDSVCNLLQEHEREYWTRTGANPYQTDGDLTVAIEKLIEYGRPHAAMHCLDRMRHAKQRIDFDLCVRALMTALTSSEPPHTMDGYRIIELIKFLQADSSGNQDDLLEVEWAYLPLFKHGAGAAPKLLECKLGNDPDFYCEVIRKIYRSKHENQLSQESTEEMKTIATNAWRLLYVWKTPPGTQNDGTFNEERFTKWFKRVKQLSVDSGHLEVAYINIGKVLIHAPADPDGLWINRSVAAALNDRGGDKLREGFRSGAYNSRGVHWIDPTGKPERELAEQFRAKAEEIEIAGFSRFAVTLRDLTDEYDREAERIIAEHKLEDN